MIFRFNNKFIIKVNSSLPFLDYREKPYSPNTFRLKTS